MLNKKFTKYYKKIILSKIKQKGFTYVLGKIIKRLINFKILVIYPIVFILCLIIKIIKPVFFIRFGNLRSVKIGPSVMITEMSLCEQENDIQPNKEKTFNIYYKGNDPHVCNKQLLKMWERILRVHPITQYFYNIMNLFSFGKDHTIEPKKFGRDIHGLLEKTPVHLTFTKKEIIQAKKELLNIGIGEKDKYVLIINRGNRYMAKTFPNLDNTYNDFRNCNINDFVPMSEKLTRKGYTVLRVGHMTSDLIETNNQKIIDYDRRGFRTDLLDIYLGANCRYIVGTDTGYMHVPGYLFRKPTVHVNFSQFEHLLPWLSSWLFIFKKYWLKDQKRFMHVGEILKSGAGRFNFYKDYKKNGIELINNTPEEITEVVDEMEKRIIGTWEDSEEDNELQKRFWSHFKSSDYSGIVKGKIGRQFLKDNRDLF